MAPKKKSARPLQLTTADVIATPDSGLSTLMRLANMVPADAVLPHFPDERCVRLGKDYFDEAVKKREFARFLDENFPRNKFAGFRNFLDEGADHPFRPKEMYTFVRETREALTMIAAHQRERSLFNVNFSFPWQLIGGWTVDRIRLCENCGKVFFANRNNKLTCSDPCSTARRVREWRKHQPQYEHARKLKSARTGKRPRRKHPKL
jgi:hypothetical protein